MKKTIEYLNRDRRVTQNFMKKLENIGLEIWYGDYSYWQRQEYVKIGKETIWLVEAFLSPDNSSSVRYRHQNEIIKEIFDTIEKQKESIEKKDEFVNNFFKAMQNVK